MPHLGALLIALSVGAGVLVGVAIGYLAGRLSQEWASDRAPSGSAEDVGTDTDPHAHGAPQGRPHD